MMNKHSKACENAKHDKCRCKCNKKYHGISKSSLLQSYQHELYEEPKQSTLLQWVKI
jgi:hypothetical protein